MAAKTRKHAQDSRHTPKAALERLTLSLLRVENTRETSRILLKHSIVARDRCVSTVRLRTSNSMRIDARGPISRKRPSCFTNVHRAMYQRRVAPSRSASSFAVVMGVVVGCQCLVIGESTYTEAGAGRVQQTSKKREKKGIEFGTDCHDLLVHSCALPAVAREPCSAPREGHSPSAQPWRRAGPFKSSLLRSSHALLSPQNTSRSSSLPLPSHSSHLSRAHACQAQQGSFYSNFRDDVHARPAAEQCPARPGLGIL